MQMAVEASGGMAVQTDTFHNPVFKDSLQRVFAKPGDAGHMGLASNAIFEVTIHSPLMGRQGCLQLSFNGDMVWGLLCS